MFFHPVSERHFDRSFHDNTPFDIMSMGRDDDLGMVLRHLDEEYLRAPVVMDVDVRSSETRLRESPDARGERHPLDRPCRTV
jgi:hypothetical protein